MGLSWQSTLWVILSSIIIIYIVTMYAWLYRRGSNAVQGRSDLNLFLWVYDFILYTALHYDIMRNMEE